MEWGFYQLKARKGRSRFFSLPEKTPRNVLLETLKKDFELAECSIVGAAVVEEFDKIMTQYDGEQGLQRIKPGEMVVTLEGQTFPLPLLSWSKINELAHDKISFSVYKNNLQYEQFQVLKEHVEEVSLKTLLSLVDHPCMAHAKIYSSIEELLPSPQRGKLGIVTPEKAGAIMKRREINDNSSPPEDIVTQILPFAAEYGLRKSLTIAMINRLYNYRNYLYPRIDELNAGQVVWLSRSIDYSPRWGRKTLDYLQPVIITLFTPDELGQPPQCKNMLKKQELKRIARITTEAYMQDGVFTMVEMEMLLKRSAGYLRKLLDLYKKHYQMWLPTAGNILDVGRCLTHKCEAVEQYLCGESTAVIARRLFHSEDAIDRYLDQFSKIALLTCMYSMNTDTISYLLNCTTSLVDEYVEIIKKHKDVLPNIKDITMNDQAKNISYGT